MEDVARGLLLDLLWGANLDISTLVTVEQIDCHFQLLPNLAVAQRSTFTASMKKLVAKLRKGRVKHADPASGIRAEPALVASRSSSVSTGYIYHIQLAENVPGGCFDYN